MKTFEERYTAWIDGKLEGPALTSFELELSRRASAGEARADKADAARLHLLLVDNLKAPAMTNGEFFSHQLRERIEAERSSGRRREEARQGRTAIFSWPFARLAGLGAAGVFVATALYYGLMPPRQTASTPSSVAKAEVAPAQSGSPVTAPPPTAGSTLANRQSPRQSGGTELALASTPPPVDLNDQISTPPPVDLNDQIEVVKVPESSTNTTATPLQYKDPNVNVLWINGLDYMPTVPGESPAAVAPAPAPMGGAQR